MFQPPPLAALDVAIHVAGQAGVLSKATRHAARKALVRVSNAEGRTLTDAPLPDVRLRHAALAGTIDARLLRDEQAALRQAEALPLLPADLAARVSAGTATLDDAIAVTMRQERWGAERVRIAGAASRLAAMALERFGKADLRATESVIDDLLARLSHSDFGLEPGSWSAFKSRVRRAVRLVDVQARQRVSESMLSGPWRALIGDAKIIDPGVGGDLAKIWPLITFCHRHAISPDDVDDSLIQRLQADLDARNRSQVFEVTRDVVYAWARLQHAVPTWPRTPLARLYKGERKRDGLSFQQLPEAIQEAWTDFVIEFARTKENSESSIADCILNDDDDIELDSAPSITCSWSSERLANGKTAIVHAANVAITLGRNPMSLEDLLSPEIVEGVLKRIMMRQRYTAKTLGVEPPAKKNNYLLATTTTLISLARDLQVDDCIAELIELRDRVDPRLQSRGKDKQGGIKRVYAEVQMGPRHRERLSQFTDDIKLLTWFDMIAILWERSEAVIRSGRTPSLEDVGDMMVCVLHALTRCCPMRRRNLAQIRCAGPRRNLILPARRGVGYLHVDWQEVKNRQDLDAELPESTVLIIRRWLDVYRPVLIDAVGADPGNPFLFPASGMTPRSASLLNKPFVERNLKVGGFLLNLHCQRHLAAKIILDQDPTAMPLVQQLLGHKSEKTTRRFYAEVNQILAQRIYHDVLERKLRTLRAGGRR